MSRFEQVWDAACVCCKADGADVPEVEAVIRLLLPQIQSAFVAIVGSIVGRAEALLNHQNDPKDIALLLAAYVTAAQRFGIQPLPPAVARNVELAARRLAQAATQASNLTGESEAVLRARAAVAADGLQVLLGGLVEFAVERSIETARRLAQEPSGSGASQTSTEQWRSELEQALDAEQALKALVDTWSYQTYNAGAVRAAAADGHNFIQLVARVDDVTTQFCRLVNGRVVPMRRAVAQLDRIDAATASGDPAALVSAAPFVTNPRHATEEDVDAQLEKGGLAPFHHGCRTRNVPIRLPE